MLNVLPKGEILCSLGFIFHSSFTLIQLPL
jgi:hypothetical protein